ncbi:MAG: FAD-binding oxidoreductase [Chloroflexota bacterium]|nr:FAD-binding oxidoreductase [Chloroflexota bacterium]
MADLPRIAEVVIIGGGVMGASIAYHLAERGCTDVVLLERAEFFGSGTTGKCAGGIRHQFSTAINIELSKRSIAMLERFPEEMDQEVDLNFCGYLFLLDNEVDMATFRQNVELQHQLGVETQLLDVDDVARLAPQINRDGLLGGTFYHRDGLVDPMSVVQGYVKQARRRGVTLFTGVSATGIDIQSGRVTGVRTPQGTIEAPTVVIAAGPWSGVVGKLAGIDLPVQPLRRQMAVTRPMERLPRDFPFVIDFARSLYFHYEAGGILTGMSNPDETPGFDTSIDEAWRLVHLEQAIQRLPILADATLHAEWAGLYEVTPDHQPILGRLPHAEGLLACTGFSGHGFMQGPICGLLMAEEILDGRAHTVNIDPLRWDRFETEAEVAEYNVV